MEASYTFFLELVIKKLDSRRQMDAPKPNLINVPNPDPRLELNYDEYLNAYDLYRRGFVMMHYMVEVRKAKARALGIPEEIYVKRQT